MTTEGTQKMAKKPWENDAAHQSTEPLIYSIPYGDYIPERPVYSTVWPGTEKADRKAGVLPVDVTVSTGGKATIMFEYRDGARYGVDVVRLFEEVDRIHKADLDSQPKPQSKKRQKKVVSNAPKVAPTKRKLVIKKATKKALRLKRSK